MIYKLLLLFTFTLPFATSAQKICAKKDVEVTIELPNGSLKGSLLVPKSKKTVPVVLLIPGSGPTDRNCNSGLGLQSNSFIYIAEALYKEKIATLRVDKRVSGESAKTFNGKDLINVKFNSFIEDTEKWIDTLQKDDRFDEIIVAGHSQGSLVGMIAANSKKADKYISISGAGTTIDKVLHEQLSETMPEQTDTIAMFLDSIRTGGYYNDGPLFLRQTLPLYLKGFLSEWMSYDPAKEISKLECPVLIINGGNDLQVSDDHAVLLHDAHHSSKLEIIGSMNHVLKDSPKDRLSNLGTYNQPDLPVNEKLIELIITFVEE